MGLGMIFSSIGVLE